MEGLSGLDDGKHYFDIFADHGVYESRYKFPGFDERRPQGENRVALDQI
jgi:hypothetical protein